MSKFVTRSGWLAPYALACGYIETVKPNDGNITLELSNNMGTGYDVFAFDHSKHTRLHWETYETLSQARKVFSSKCKEYGLKRKLNRRIHFL